MSDPERLRSYLLGEMSEAESAAVEERYFRDAEYFELLEATADDLIGADLNHECNAAQQQHIATLEHAARWRWRRQFLSALRQVADSDAESPSPLTQLGESRLAPHEQVGTLSRLPGPWRGAAPAFRLLAGGTVSALVLLGLFAGGRLVALRRTIVALQSELSREQQRGNAQSAASAGEREALRAERDALQARLQGVSTVALALIPGSLRDMGFRSNRGRIVPGTSFLRIELALDAELERGVTHVVRVWRDTSALDVSAAPPAWSEILSSDSFARSQSGSVDVVVPVAALGQGRYQLTLSARRGSNLESVADYHFELIAPPTARP